MHVEVEVDVVIVLEPGFDEAIQLADGQGFGMGEEVVIREDGFLAFFLFGGTDDGLEDADVRGDVFEEEGFGDEFLELEGLGAVGVPLTEGDRAEGESESENGQTQIFEFAQPVFAHRTVAWFGENLAGKSDFLDAIFHTSVSAAAPFFTDKKGNRSLTLTNTSDIVILISGAGDDWKGSVRLPARSSDIIKIKGEPRSIAVNVTNFHTGLNQTLTTNLDIPAK